MSDNWANLEQPALQSNPTDFRDAQFRVQDVGNAGNQAVGQRSRRSRTGHSPPPPNKPSPPKKPSTLHNKNSTKSDSKNKQPTKSSATNSPNNTSAPTNQAT
jgi:hypothetical protein